MLRYAKPFFACLLCLLLVAIPLVDNCNAVVTTATVAGVLILTLLVAMGITLVVASGTKEDFILSKGSDFMQAKGYQGTFQDWLAVSPGDALMMQVGKLFVESSVVTKAKEFIAWLIPSAASNTVHQFNDAGSANIIDGYVVYSGTINYSRSGNPFITVSNVGKLWRSASGDTDTVIQGQNTSVSLASDGTTDYMTVINGYNSTSGALINQTWNLQHSTTSPQGFALIKVTQFTNTSSRPAVYAVQWNGNASTAVGFVNGNSNPVYSFDLNELTTEDAGNSAIIGDYNDLSNLTGTPGVGSNNTTVYNTFNISQSGQAVGQETSDLADIVNALQQALDDLQNKIDIIPVTAEVQAAENIEPPYNDFELGNLNFSALGALLTTRFPFSIPWDLMRIYNTFVTEPEAPHWELNLFADSSLSRSGIDGTVSVDLGNYPIVGTISRWFCIIEFCMFLAFATKKLVWTA